MCFNRLLASHVLYPRRFPADHQDRAAALSRLRRRASRSSTTTATCRPRTSRRTGGSTTCSRSGWRATTTSGAPCGPTASTSASAPATRRPYEKFLAWARTVPHTLRNPLYHWTHLELKRYFGIDELLDERQRAARSGSRPTPRWPPTILRAHGILGKFHVKAVCTTDDPTDDLRCHKAIARLRARDQGLPDLPSRQGAQRPSARGLQSLGGPAGGGQPTSHIAQLPAISSTRSASGTTIFHADGRPPLRSRPESRATPISAPIARPPAIFDARAHGQAATPEEHAHVRVVPDAVLRPPGRGEGLDQAAAPGRAAQQQHAPLRANWVPTPASTRSATGRRPTRSARYLDRLDQENALPKIVLYNLNPADNYVFATMIGNFQDGIDRRARCSSAAAGGSSIRRKPWSGR